MKPENLTIILVEPQGPINIGSVCRAMMNFGFLNLKLVNPCSEYLSNDARKMALKAWPLLEKAEIFNDLKSALAECHIAFGTTRRFGKYRKDFFTPEKAGKKIAETQDELKCAIVLGREDSGLTTSELTLCQHFVTIPTNDSFASMNLSHSLSICLYEISKAFGQVHLKESKQTGQNSSADMAELEQMYAHIKKTLLSIDFLSPENPDHILRTFRRIFGRAALDSRDVKIIHGLMNRIDWTENQRLKNVRFHHSKA
ncbi:MAG: RNA methyltransferase [Thermodesulfobacteriota bacterium]|nr:RNA methyltransferase [Thermodesulfobacteriota bacterium]